MTAARTAKRINLALQGGGAHGAFTWGVLDRLLEVEDLEIAGISGTSAGAVNGAAVKAGLLIGGRQGARDNLEWLWDQLGALSDWPVAEWFAGTLLSPGYVSRMIEASIGYQAADMATRVVSPYGLGPVYRNPLEKVLKLLRFEHVCADQGPALFVSATNVRTGKIRVFSHTELNIDTILASACLPTVFQAVEIRDEKTGKLEAYWDGGYTGNPALFPLFGADMPDDIIIVDINPTYRQNLPITPQDILNRINEISFNASLLGELRAIAFVKRLVAGGQIERGRMKDLNMHIIADNDLMRDLTVATKLVPVPYVLQELRDAGRQAAEDFLNTHWDDIGVRGTIDLQAAYG